MRQSEEWRFGREVEEYVIARRKLQGCWIIRTHLIGPTGAPMLEGWDGKEILPDIISGHGGRSVLLEIKGKSRITKNKRYRRDEHGIALKNWLSYQEVERQLGITCLLGIYDAGIPDPKFGLPGYPHCYYEASLESTKNAAREARDDGTLRKFGEPMVFFDMRHFDYFDLNSEGPIVPTPPTPISPKVVRPWESGRVHRPQECRQPPLF